MGLRDAQHIVVTLHVAGPFLETFAAIFFLVQLIPLGIVLDHCSHSPVVDCNLARKERSNVLSKTIATSNKVWERLWVECSRLREVDIQVFVWMCGLGTYFHDFFVCKLRVHVWIGHMVASSIRRWKRWLHCGFRRCIIIAEFDARNQFGRFWCHDFFSISGLILQQNEVVS